MNDLRKLIITAVQARVDAIAPMDGAWDEAMAGASCWVESLRMLAPGQSLLQNWRAVADVLGTVVVSLVDVNPTAVIANLLDDPLWLLPVEATDWHVELTLTEWTDAHDNSGAIALLHLDVRGALMTKLSAAPPMVTTVVQAGL